MTQTAGGSSSRARSSRQREVGRRRRADAGAPRARRAPPGRRRRSPATRPRSISPSGPRTSSPSRSTIAAFTSSSSRSSRWTMSSLEIDGRAVARERAQQLGLPGADPARDGDRDRAAASSRVGSSSPCGGAGFALGRRRLARALAGLRALSASGSAASSGSAGSSASTAGSSSARARRRRSGLGAPRPARPPRRRALGEDLLGEPQPRAPSARWPRRPRRRASARATGGGARRPSR